MSPLVSVIILNWNGGVHVQSCLDSLTIQDYDNLEIIVVDNGSTDGSVEMIRGALPGGAAHRKPREPRFCRGQ